jgi:hypothetical protein
MLANDLFRLLAAAAVLEWAVVLIALAVAGTAIVWRARAFFRRDGGCICGGGPKDCPAGRALSALRRLTDESTDFDRH